MKETESAGELLTSAECAEYLKMSLRHVYKLQRTDGLPLIKVGCSWRIFRCDLVDWLRERQAEQNAAKVCDKIGRDTTCVATIPEAEQTGGAV